jgi:hypothetical protein
MKRPATSQMGYLNTNSIPEDPWMELLGDVSGSQINRYFWIQ